MQANFEMAAVFGNTGMEFPESLQAAVSL